MNGRRRVNSTVGQPSMIDRIDHHLRRPSSDDEWSAYHMIRRKVLFENRGSFGVYNENHPDNFKAEITL
jgi:hypothetical protein